MAISRNIRSIWVTDYDKSIGDVASYLDSGSGFSPALPTVPTYRSTITGVREIRVDSYFWGESIGDILWTGTAATLDEDLTAGETTITLDSNADFTGGDVVGDAGYILIEDEIIKYTGTSGDYDLTGCVRGQFDTTDVQHDGTASTIDVYIWLRGVVQSVDYEPEDEVYAVRVALPLIIVGGGGQGGTPTIRDYYIYRFEFSKHLVDLVLYEDTEGTETITGYVPGFEPQ